MENLRNSTLIRVMSFMQHRICPYLSMLTVNVIGNTVFFRVVIAYTLRNIINAALDGRGNAVGDQLAITLIAFALGVVIQMITGYIINICIRGTVADIKERVFNHLILLKMSCFNEFHSGDMISRLTNDIDTMQGIYTRQFSSILQSVSESIIALITIYLMEKRIALLVLVLGLITISINTLFAKRIRTYSDKIQVHKARLMEFLIDILRGIPIIKIFNIGSIISSRYTTENDTLAKTTMKHAHVESSFISLDNMSLDLKRLGILALGLYMVINGDGIDVGTVAAIMYLQHQASDFFSEISSYISDIQSSLAGGRRVIEFLRFPIEDMSKKPYSGTSDVINNDTILSFEGVDFRYQEGCDVLHGINMQVKKNQTVALVGPSGGGKSTITKLIMGFYPKSGGNIYINGREIDTYAADELREWIAYVPQEPYLFNGTIFENIRNGSESASEEDVYNAARLADAHEFISALEHSYNTIVGKNGILLSGGQKQRVCLARALIKKAPLLILDEASSALDTESEEQIYKMLRAQTQQRTIIIVAHRLSAIQNVDTIYVVDGGCVAERGTHEELMQHNNIYAQLYRNSFIH